MEVNKETVIPTPPHPTGSTNAARQHLTSAAWAGYGQEMTGQGMWWRRVLVAGAAGVVLAGGLIAPAVAAAPGDRIGTGKITCVPGPGADCRDVVQKWTFTHHGDLSGA